MFDDASVVHPGGKLFYAIVCRVALGIAACTKDGETILPSPSQMDQHSAHTALAEAAPLYTSADRKEFALINGTSPGVHYRSSVALSRRREFMVFNSNRVLEEYIIAFRRLLDPTQPVPKLSV